MNTPGRDSENPLTQAMRDLEGMRGANRELRKMQPPVDVPPLTDEEIIEAFRKDTGLIIDANGNVIGEDRDWVPPGGAPTVQATVQPGEPPRAYHPLSFGEKKDAAPKEVEVFGFGKKRSPLVGGSRIALDQIKGIDLVNGEVIVDNMRYPITPEEVSNVARFCLNAMLRDLQSQIADLAKVYDIPVGVQGGDSGVQGVPAQPAGGEVPQGADGVQGVRGAVEGAPAADDAGGEGGAAS